MTSRVTTVATPLKRSMVTSNVPDFLYGIGQQHVLPVDFHTLGRPDGLDHVGGVTDPNRRPPPSARAVMVMTAPARIVAWLSAAP